MARTLGLWAAAIVLPATALADPTCPSPIVMTPGELPSPDAAVQISSSRALISSRECVDEEGVQIKPECACALRELGTMLAAGARDRILIEGHAARSRSEERDLVRSDRAARAVFRFLVKPAARGGAGLPREHLSLVSHGSAQPIVMTDPKDRRNDRVEIELRLPIDRRIPTVQPRRDADYK